MSAIYGYASTIANGNSADERISAMNRQIDAQNSLARDNFSRLRQGEKENKLVAEQNVNETEIKDRVDEGEEGGKVMSAVNDLTAKRTETSLDTSEGQEEPDEVDAEIRPQDEGGNGGSADGEVSVDVKPKGEAGSFDVVREKVDFDSDRLFTTEGSLGLETGGQIGLNPIGSGFRYVVKAYPVNEGRPAGVEDMISPIEETSSSAEEVSKSGNMIKNVVSKIGTEGGVLGEGLSGALKGATILTGGYDLVKDIGDKGYFSNLGGKGLTADKVSNVAGVVSGGLETAGLVADSTGVGAIVGVPLQALGLISGGVGLVSGLIGDIKDEGKQKQAVASMPQVKAGQTAPQQNKVAFSSAFQGGQLVQ